MAITNTKIFGKHLDADISKIFFDDFIPAAREYDKIAKVAPAPAGNHYTEAELSDLGELQDLGEGAGIQFDLPVEGHEKTIYYYGYGLGFQITRYMMKDDLQRNFEKMPSKLSKSARYKPETVFFDLFNNGFTTATSWDGQSIFDTDHATMKSADTIANELTAATLSETSLQAAFEYYDGLLSEAGLMLDFDGPKTLLVPTALRATAFKLMQTQGKLGSAQNDINLMALQNDYVDYKLHVSKFLTSDTAFFLLSPQHDFRLYWKEEAELESADDFYTGNALFKVTERFGVGCFDYKGGCGNAGA